MKTVELINDVIFTSCKIVNDIHEPVMRLIFGLKWLCLLLLEVKTRAENGKLLRRFADLLTGKYQKIPTQENLVFQNF